MTATIRTIIVAGFSLGITAAILSCDKIDGPNERGQYAAQNTVPSDELPDGPVVNNNDQTAGPTPKPTPVEVLLNEPLLDAVSGA